MSIYKEQFQYEWDAIYDDAIDRGLTEGQASAIADTLALGRLNNRLADMADMLRDRAKEA